MAQGRPMSRHGRYEPFIGMQVEEAEAQDFYKRTDYNSPRYASPRPKSGYRRRKSPPADYDQFARVPSSRDQHREDPPARPMSRIGMDGHSSGSHHHHHQSLEDSDDSFSPSPPSQPHGSPTSPPRHVHKSKAGPERPPSASSRRPQSGRPQSANIRSARVRYVEQTPNQFEEEDDLPDMSGVRPPSSFSKYRLLPAIGTPTPLDLDDGPPSTYLYNEIDEPRPPSRHQTPTSHRPPSQQHQSYHLPSAPEQPPPPQLARRTGGVGKSSRVSSAVSDISVISTKASSRMQNHHYNDDLHNLKAEGVERLDLSQLDKPLSDSVRRKKISASGSSPAHKPKTSSSTANAGAKHNAKAHVDLYDGDDDDSDTVQTSSSRKNTETTSNRPPRSASVVKQPVIIPSPDHPPDREILLAIKLPTDSTRHQRYFKCKETLQSIVEFAEELAGQDLGGYILVSSAPKMVYSDLELSIDAAGLEDKTVLHLEEGD